MAGEDQAKQFNWDEEDKKAATATAAPAGGAPAAGFTWDQDPGLQAATTDKAADQQRQEQAARHGAMQRTKGGQIFNPEDLERKPTPLSAVAREGALGLSSGYSGAPESPTPLHDINEQEKAEETKREAHPILSSLEAGTIGPLENLYGLGKGLYGAGKEIYTGVSDKDPAAVAHGGGSLVGQALMLGAGAEAPEAAGRESTLLPIGKAAVTKPLEAYHVGLSGEDLLTKGVGPKSTNLAWRPAIERPGVQRALKTAGDTSAAQLNEALPGMKDKIWDEEVEPAMKRQADRPVDMKPAADAVRKVITPEMEEFDENQAEKLKILADKLEKSRDVDGAGRLLKYVNGQLDSYFNRYPSARRANLMSDPETAGWEASRRAIREQLMGTLEEAGETQVRDARLDYGGLETVAKEVERRVNQADRMKPVSLARMLGLMGAPFSGGLTLALGEYAHHLNKPDVLINRGIERLNPEPAAPFTPPPAFEKPQPQYDYAVGPQQLAHPEPIGPQLPAGWRPGATRPEPAPGFDITEAPGRSSLFPQERPQVNAPPNLTWGGPLQRIEGTAPAEAAPPRREPWAPPPVESQYKLERIRPEGETNENPNALGEAGQGAVRVPPGSRQLPAPPARERTAPPPVETQHRLERIHPEVERETVQDPNALGPAGEGGIRIAPGSRELPPPSWRTAGPQEPGRLSPIGKATSTSIDTLRSLFKGRPEAAPQSEPVSKIYTPEELEDARLMIESELGMMRSGDRPGRYFNEVERGTMNPQREQRADKGVFAGGQWMGVKSIRNSLPWFRNSSLSPSVVERALKNGQGPVYEQIMRSAAEQVRREHATNAGEREAIGKENEGEEVNFMPSEETQTQQPYKIEHRMGLDWAIPPEGGFSVSIPKDLPEAERPAYVEKMFKLQREQKPNLFK
jgi:hypothetical protein